MSLGTNHVYISQMCDNLPLPKALYLALLEHIGCLENVLENLTMNF